MVVDPVSNFITKLKNASLAKKQLVSVPHSKFIESIADLLKKEGFIKDLAKKGKSVVKTLDVEILYVDGKPRITDVRRVSKFSKRVYQGSKDIKPVRNGLGLLVLTTPKGIMTDKTAKKDKVGGEALFKIW